MSDEEQKLLELLKKAEDEMDRLTGEKSGTGTDAWVQNTVGGE